MAFSDEPTWAHLGHHRLNTSDRQHGGGIEPIGGGSGGLTTAVALARKGLRAEVYEQASELNEVGAGAGLWGNALRALEALGLAGEVSKLAVQAVGSGVRRPGRSTCPRR